LKGLELIFNNGTGAGESGKSTILKQMRLLYSSGFSNSEREGYVCIIFSNVLDTFRGLLNAMDSFGLELHRESNKVC
jgi:guanine nucleotide-binding protein subunit alpha